jgi:hypothetical protein
MVNAASQTLRAREVYKNRILTGGCSQGVPSEAFDKETVTKALLGIPWQRHGAGNETFRNAGRRAVSMWINDVLKFVFRVLLGLSACKGV